MSSKLTSKVIKRVKGMRFIEAFDVFSVAALDLAVVPGSIGTDKLVLNAKASGGRFKKCRQLTFGIGEAVREFKTVICLDTFHADPMPGVPLA